MYCIDIKYENNHIVVSISLKQKPSKKINWWDKTTTINDKIKANSNSDNIASVSFTKNDDGYYYGGCLYVEEEYRRQGIASFMYEIVESHGFKIKPSKLLSHSGKKFWDNRLI